MQGNALFSRKFTQVEKFFWLWRSWQISSLLVSWFPSFFQMKVLIENTSVAQSRASWGQWELFRAAWWHLWPKKLHLGRQITKKTGDRKVFWTKRPTGGFGRARWQHCFRHGICGTSGSCAKDFWARVKLTQKITLSVKLPNSSLSFHKTTWVCLYLIKKNWQFFF